MRVNKPESDNYWTVNVRGEHRIQLSKRVRAGLAKRQIPTVCIARFHSKYQKTPSCWLWTAGRLPSGYGQMSLGRDFQGRQHTEYAHRVAYVLTRGEIPTGLVVMHTCDIPACVNPNHLVLGTQAENVLDAARKGHYHGPRPHTRKLSDAQVAEIRCSKDKGVVLAKRFGVTPSCISSIRNLKYRKVEAMAHQDDPKAPSVALQPDDARIFDIFRELEDQYSHYLQVNGPTGVEVWAEADTDAPAMPGSVDLPLSLTVWADPQ